MVDIRKKKEKTKIEKIATTKKGHMKVKKKSKFMKNQFLRYHGP